MTLQRNVIWKKLRMFIHSTNYVVSFILLLVPFFGWGQTVYTSPLTQTWPTIFTTHFEDINRSISFEENTITIGTETESGKEFRIYRIQEISFINDHLTYFCLTSNNEKVTIAVPYQEEIEIIDLYKKDSTGEEMQVRFHMDH